MKRLVTTITLTFVLSISALAGDIHTGDSPAPAPSGTPQLMATPGEIPSAFTVMATRDALQQVSDAALSALLSVLSFV